MRVVVLQSNYIPWKGYFDLIHDADLFIFYDEVKYTKNDWRNRNQVKSKNGSHYLTIPIDKNAVKQKISEVRLPPPSWQADHAKTLRQSYGRAPHFDQLSPLIREIWEEHQWDKLSELNCHVTQRVASMLSITTRFAQSRDFAVEGDRIERLLGILSAAGATSYISGPSAAVYLKGFEDEFARRGIELIYKDYSGYPSYRQLSEPFEHAVSILDLIANLPLSEIPAHIWGWRGTST